MWQCPICLKKEENRYICSGCGFDKRSDFVENRTLCSVDKENLEYRKIFVQNIVTRNTLDEISQRYDALCKKYESSLNEIEVLKKALQRQKEGVY